MESCDLYDSYDDNHSDHGDLDFLQVELVRSKSSISVLERSESLVPFGNGPDLSAGKSDSVLAMADATLDHLDHDALFLCHIEPSIFADHLSPYHGSPSRTSSFFNASRGGSRPPLANIRRSSSTGSEDLLRPHFTNHPAPAPRVSRLSAFLQELENDDGQEALLNNQLNEQRTLNGRLLAGVGGAERASTDRLSSKGQAHRAGMIKGVY